MVPGAVAVGQPGRGGHGQAHAEAGKPVALDNERAVMTRRTVVKKAQDQRIARLRVQLEAAGDLVPDRFPARVDDQRAAAILGHGNQAVGNEPGKLLAAGRRELGRRPDRPLQHLAQLRLKNDNETDQGHMADVVVDPLYALQVEQIGANEHHQGQKNAGHDLPGAEPCQRQQQEKHAGGDQNDVQQCTPGKRHRQKRRGNIHEPRGKKERRRGQRLCFRPQLPYSIPSSPRFAQSFCQAPARADGRAQKESLALSLFFASIGGLKFFLSRRAIMSRVCAICGKAPVSGNNVSHAHNKTRRRWMPNLQRVRALSENGGTVHVDVCTRCIRSGAIVKPQR